MMKANCHAVHLWPSKKKKEEAIHFNFCPPSFFFFFSSLSFCLLSFLPEVFVFSGSSSSRTLSASHHKKRNVRKTEAQGEGRNALTECMIDPSVCLWRLSGAACVSRVGGKKRKKAKTPPVAAEAAEAAEAATLLVFLSLTWTESWPGRRPAEWVLWPGQTTRPLRERDVRISSTTASRFYFFFFWRENLDFER